MDPVVARPWLVSQTLMQLLYLLPAGVLCCGSRFHEGRGGSRTAHAAQSAMAMIGFPTARGDIARGPAEIPRDRTRSRPRSGFDRDHPRSDPGEDLDRAKRLAEMGVARGRADVPAREGGRAVR